MSVTYYRDIAQGTDEWAEIRLGMVTASVVGQLITPKTMKVASNPDTRALTAQLAAERINGWSDNDYVSWDMQRGHDDEPLARDMYSKHHAPVDECGFVVREEDGWTLGCSPDGLVGEPGLIEVKSRKAAKQVAAVVSGGVPSEHMAQVQAALAVTGREWVDYISWSGGMAFWPVRVYPDAEWQAVIVEAVIALEAAVTRMVADYRAAVEGLPATERRVMEVVI